MSVKITRNGDVINVFANGFDFVQRAGVETLWMYDEYPLTREDVIELLPILQRFVQTGSIEERQSISKSEQKRIACQRGISVDELNRELNQPPNESEAAT